MISPRKLTKRPAPEKLLDVRHMGFQTPGFRKSEGGVLRAMSLGLDADGGGEGEGVRGWR